MASVHRLGRRLQGYLIPFTPYAFVYQRQDRPRILPSISVFLPRSTDFTPPLAIPDPSAVLYLESI